jgi:L-alanine-DL-glutamate epimerase-like enolase superfamily enzyme
MPKDALARHDVDRRAVLSGALGTGALALAGGLTPPLAHARQAAEKGGAIHRVADVSVRLFKWPVQPGKDHTGYARTPEVELAVVTIKSDQGAVGNSFLGAHRMSGERWGADLLQFLKPVVMGQNALDLGRLWQNLYGQSGYLMFPVLAAMDIALWDLAGRVMGQPIHRLIGTARDRALAYASSAPNQTAEQYVEEAKHYQSLGWKAYKLHPRKNANEDIQVCTAVREAVGPDMTLLCDSMWAYRFEEAVRVGRALEELDYYWFEDPLPREDVYGNTKLCAELDIPVMATEIGRDGFYGMAKYITERATDILRSDAVLHGGITPLIRTTHLADAFNMNCEIHSAGNGYNNVANLNVLMATLNSDFFELLLPHDLEAYGLTENITVDRDGYVHAPTGPGLGYEVDWELVEQRTTRTLA